MLFLLFSSSKRRRHQNDDYVSSLLARPLLPGLRTVTMGCNNTPSFFILVFGVVYVARVLCTKE